MLYEEWKVCTKITVTQQTQITVRSTQADAFPTGHRFAFSTASDLVKVNIYISPWTNVFYYFRFYSGYDSCATALKENANKENEYQINVPGTSRYLKATCKLIQGLPGIVLLHDNLNSNYVHGFEGKGAYRKTLDYGSNITDISIIMKEARSCKQFVRIECSEAVFTFPNGRYAWLEDRNGFKLPYMAGGPANGTGCACGITGTCDDPSKKCNCDKNTLPVTIDEGYVTQKEKLPITAVLFGDTGHSNEYVNYTISGVECIFPGNHFYHKFLAPGFITKTKENILRQ